MLLSLVSKVLSLSSVGGSSDLKEKKESVYHSQKMNKDMTAATRKNSQINERFHITDLQHLVSVIRKNKERRTGKKKKQILGNTRPLEISDYKVQFAKNQRPRKS